MQKTVQNERKKTRKQKVNLESEKTSKERKYHWD